MAAARRRCARSGGGRAADGVQPAGAPRRRRGAAHRRAGLDAHRAPVDRAQPRAHARARHRPRRARAARRAALRPRLAGAVPRDPGKIAVDHQAFTGLAHPRPKPWCVPGFDVEVRRAGLHRAPPGQRADHAGAGGLHAPAGELARAVRGGPAHLLRGARPHRRVRARHRAGDAIRGSVSLASRGAGNTLSAQLRHELVPLRRIPAPVGIPAPAGRVLELRDAASGLGPLVAVRHRGVRG